jgi:nitrate/nitrite sensing protein/HAAS domain-containing protein
MSGTALDHRLVRDYLRDLDKAMRGLPDTQARELKEQITAHLDDALQPGAGDDEVTATLSRLGSPADLAAEAGAASGSSGPGLALSGRRVRWRLAAIIAVPAVIAAVLGALQISGDVSSYAASGRVQHLAGLDAAVISLTQKLEDERDLSAAYAAREDNGPLTRVRAATDAAASAVRADAAGVGAGYSAGTVQDLKALLAGLTVLGDIRGTVSAPGIIRLYSLIVIRPAITFSTAAGDGTGDPRLQASVTTLAALLKVENEMSVQRAILYAALSARPPVLAPADQTSLLQAVQQQHADLSDFNASTDTTEQRLFSNTVSGAAVDRALEAEARAEAVPVAQLKGRFGLDAATWYGDMSTTIGDTREVANQLVGQVTARAGALRSDATTRLVLTSIATLGLLLLVLLISAAVGRSLTRPPRH